VRILNLGILAHVDAGKTSLTERLLHRAGVIGEIGSVDRGTTQTDFLALERQRGITIKSAVVSFAVDGVTVNLIDTPGHPDFIAEVERVLNVLDGAVLVLSAVEGVQPQTRVLMRTLRRLGIPTLIFVNKIDRGGARRAHVLQDVSAKLSLDVVAMNSVDGLGTRSASVVPTGDLYARLIDLLAANDDALLAAYVDGRTISPRRLRCELAAQTARTMVHPVFFGSAMTGAGVAELSAGITALLPTAEGAADGPASGTVFKVERGPAGEKLAYVRMFSGTVRVRDRLECGAGEQAKITAISIFEQGRTVRSTSVIAGQIGKLSGLADAQVGDSIGAGAISAGSRYFAPPSLEAVVVPRRAADRGAVQAALTQLVEQDPLINLRQDNVRHELVVSLYGEVQKEVIQATLADDFGVDITFRETTTICVERPIGIGEAVERIGTESNPFLATVGLRVEPAPIGSVEFRVGVELGSMPFAFFRAVEETVHETLHRGIHGWQVTDCVVTMTHSGYYARQSHSHGTFDKSMSSTAGDFCNLTPLVVMDALQQASTCVYEPIHRFHVRLPADAVATALRGLAELRAVPQAPSVRGSTAVLDGDIPAARVHELQQRLPTITHGEGVADTEFDHYAPVRGVIAHRYRYVRCGGVPDRLLD
jgi:ribosomal protection tetracycline resistance protein